MDKKPTKISESPEKALIAQELVDTGLKHGVFVVVFDGPEDMNNAMDNMRLGASIKIAIEAERARQAIAEARTAPRH